MAYKIGMSKPEYFFTILLLDHLIPLDYTRDIIISEIKANNVTPDLISNILIDSINVLGENSHIIPYLKAEFIMFFDKTDDTSMARSLWNNSFTKKSSPEASMSLFYSNEKDFNSTLLLKSLMFYHEVYPIRLTLLSKADKIN